jgi:hypothetical protein
MKSSNSMRNQAANIKSSHLKQIIGKYSLKAEIIIKEEYIYFLASFLLSIQWLPQRSNFLHRSFIAISVHKEKFALKNYRNSGVHLELLKVFSKLLSFS